MPVTSSASFANHLPTIPLLPGGKAGMRADVSCSRSDKSFNPRLPSAIHD